MANNHHPAEEEEESSPLLPTDNTQTHEPESNQKQGAQFSAPPSPPSKQHPVPPMTEPQTYGWTADGLVVGQPIMGRTPWSSGFFSCLGHQDAFFSSDLEVCLLGSVAPCVLYGTNAERLGSTSGSFTSHCMTYTALYLIGNSFFGWNCLAPWFSYSTRTAIRRSFNLEGSCEALTRHCGCGGSFVEDDVQREQCEMACDFATHVFCHPCSLCQEGREIRRRLPHPGFTTQQVVVMIPPGEQSMGRH
ncbi:cell number regulator 8 [Silene latifolia]|uniref:cell number regulator 8 n=1 Tax=Silene latifolia TaxID=37657 RepID=UPI003D788F52